MLGGVRLRLLLAALAAVALVSLLAGTAQAGGGGTDTALLETLYQGGACGPAALNTYPADLCDAPFPSTTYRDQWGFTDRYCGSYAAWMVASEGDQPPEFAADGFPGYWPEHVPASWIVATPKAGDIAVIPSISTMPRGHALYVISGNWHHDTGDLLVSAYNTDGEGDFSLAVWAPGGEYDGVPFSLVYIQFPKAG